MNGVGLHTGKNVTIKFLPAPHDVGYCFVRDDLDGNPEVEAEVQWVYDTQRGTNLDKNGVVINTTEHENTFTLHTAAEKEKFIARVCNVL